MRPTPFRRRTAAAALSLALGAALLLGACSSKAPSQPELVDALVTSGVPKSEATCAARAIDSTLTEEQIALIVERGGGGAPRDDPNTTTDPMDKVRAALTKCRDAAPPPPTTSTTSTLPVPSTVAPTSPPSTAGQPSTTASN